MLPRLPAPGACPGVVSAPARQEPRAPRADGCHRWSTASLRTASRLLTLLAVLGLGPAARMAEVAPRMLLLDGAVVGSDVVAVGERGAILRSSDQGRTWSQTSQPAAVTLTGISFSPDGRQGWVVGHEALVLGSNDGGRTWQQHFKGDVQDSFLDVLAIDARRAFAVGAYALCMATTDGGKTWTRIQVTTCDNHYYRITQGPTGTLYIAGEHGILLRSLDGGTEWKSIQTPYNGSFFGILPLGRVHLLAYGLRGHVFRSADDGATWEQVPAPHPVLLASGIRTRNNAIVLAGQVRGLLISRDGGKTLQPLPEPGGALAEVIELPNSTLLGLGENGATVFSLPAP